MPVMGGKGMRKKPRKMMAVTRKAMMPKGRAAEMVVEGARRRRRQP